MIKKLICINCPRGCELNVEVNDGKIVVTGNGCKRGENYAIDEMTNPKRIVTSSISVKEGILARVSVKTEFAIDKAKIFDCVKEIKKLKIVAPVKIGDILIENVCGTGVNIVATNNVEKRA